MNVRFSLKTLHVLVLLIGCSSKRDLGNIPDGGTAGQGGKGTQGGTAGTGGGPGGSGSGTAGQGGLGGNAGPCNGGPLLLCVDSTPVCNLADCPTGTAGTNGGAGRGGAGGGAAGAGGTAGTGGSSGSGGNAGASGSSGGAAGGRGGSTGATGGRGGGSGGGTGGTGASACPNIVGYWPADDDGHDAVGNNDATLQDGVTFARGKFGDAFSFNGASSVVATRVPNLPIQGSWTYAFWINVNSYPAGDMTLFLDRTINTLGLISLRPMGNSFHFEVRYDDGTGLGGPTGGTIRIGTWTHVALVRDVGKQFYLYVDGQNVGSTSDTGGVLTPPVFKLGKHATDPNGGFTGLIDDFRIFDAALTGTQIQGLANNQLCAVSSGAGGNGGSGGAGGSTATFPSCVGLAPTCGPNRDQDCCASALVPGGSFNRSNDSAYPATVSPFRLDIYTVTLGRFRQFVAAYYGKGWRPSPGQGKNPHYSADSGWTTAWDANLTADMAGSMTSQFVCDGKFPTWTASPGGNENKPMTCPSWYEAFAFCAWDGGRLVTEAEYNFASAGGSEQRFYPWSNPPGDTTIDTSYLSYNCMSDGSAMGDCAATDVMVVGSKPKGNGKWGHADLAGNVLQWTRDWNGTYQTPCSDCAQTTTVDMWRLLRGGSYSYAANYQTTAFRYGFYSGYFMSSEIGFRCARDP